MFSHCSVIGFCFFLHCCPFCLVFWDLHINEWSLYFASDSVLPSLLWHCWLGIRKSIRPVKLSDEMLMWLRVWREVQIGERCRLFVYGPADATESQTPSSLVSFKSRLVLPFWYWLTQVVPEKRPLNVCSGSSLCYHVVSVLCDTASLLPSPSHHIAPVRPLMPPNVATAVPQGLQLSSSSLSTVPHLASTPTAVILPHVWCIHIPFIAL